MDNISSLTTHLSFDSQKWGSLGAGTSLSIDETDLVRLRGFNDTVTLAEVKEIYLPLSRLLNMYVAASQELYRAGDTFLGKLPAKVPFVIGIAGSVAVGKSTAARVLQALLSRWPHSPRVDLITTDGFLYPNEILSERSLLERKGFPESYDRRSLLRFLSEVKSGKSKVEAPVYSHLKYDVVEGDLVEISQPDVLIVEGLTVLQTGSTDADYPMFVSDYFDFSIYVDADIEAIRSWYVQRFLALRQSAFSDPKSYFHRYSSLSDSEAVEVANQIWLSINEKNLLENILPTRPRADLILTKLEDHRIHEVKLRRL